MPDTYQCSACHEIKPRNEYHRAFYNDRPRDVPSRCKLCRKEARYAKIFPDTTCIQCLGHRPVYGNRICRRCNAESGLRECKVCMDVLPILLEFKGRSTTCKRCLKQSKVQEPKAPSR